MESMDTQSCARISRCIPPLRAGTGIHHTKTLESLLPQKRTLGTAPGVPLMRKVVETSFQRYRALVHSEIEKITLERTGRPLPLQEVYCINRVLLDPDLANVFFRMFTEEYLRTERTPRDASRAYTGALRVYHTALVSCLSSLGAPLSVVPLDLKKLRKENLAQGQRFFDEVYEKKPLTYHKTPARRHVWVGAHMVG